MKKIIFILLLITGCEQHTHHHYWHNYKYEYQYKIIDGNKTYKIDPTSPIYKEKI